MKKRMLAFLLAIVMVIGMVTPVAVAADYQTDYQMQVEGSKVKLDDGTDGLTMTVKIKAPTIQGTSLIFLSIDKSKLELSGKDGTLMTAPENEDDPSFYPDDFTEDGSWGAAYNNARFVPSLVLMERNNRSWLVISMEATSAITRFNVALDNANSKAYNFCLKLASGVDYADLDNDAIRLATFEEITGFNQPGAALICNDADEYTNGGVTYSGGVGSDNHESDNLAAPKILVDDAELPAPSLNPSTEPTGTVGEYNDASDSRTVTITNAKANTTYNVYAEKTVTADGVTYGNLLKTFTSAATITDNKAEDSISRPAATTTEAEKDVVKALNLGGTYYITATESGKSESTALEVKDIPARANKILDDVSLTLDSPVTIPTGGSLPPDTLPDKADVTVTYNAATGAENWDGNSAITVSDVKLDSWDGNFAAVGTTVPITADFNTADLAAKNLDANGKKATAAVTVADPVATTVKIFADQADVTGKTIQITKPQDATPAQKNLTTEVKDQFGTVMSNPTVTWNISTPVSGITVDSNGVVSVTQDAADNAEATITATCDGKTASVTVKAIGANENELTTFSLPENLKYGDTFEVVIGGTNNNGSAITWTSENAEQVGNSTGITAKFKVTGVGDVKITATQNYKADGNVAGYDKSVTTTAGKRVAEIDVSGLSVTAKDYDGTATAEVTGTATVTNKVGNDDVTLSGAVTGTFADANAGDKTVTIAGLTLSGDQAANYELPAKLPTVSGTINQKELTWGGSTTKTYDGTTAVELGSLTLATDVGGENVSITSVTGTYDDANVGDTKNITLTGAEFTVTGGDAGNYKLPASAVLATGEITPASLALSEAAGPVSTTLGGLKLSQFATATGLVNGEDLDNVYSLTKSDTTGVYTAADGKIKVTFYQAVEHAEAELTPAYTEYVAAYPEAGKTYYADLEATAGDAGNYTLEAVTATGKPDNDSDETALANYVKVTVSTSGGGGGGGSAAPKTYKVTFNAGKGGTLSGDAVVTVNKGDTLTNAPKVDAKDRFIFLGWSADGKTVLNEKTFSFSADVTLTALYKEVYMNGYADNRFAPKAEITRAEVAAILARLSADYDEDTAYPAAADDVAADAWYASAVNFCAQKGLLSGYSDGSMRPGDKITREELATMLCRFLNLEKADGADFGDVAADRWSAGYIGALTEAGVVNGYDGNAFRPAVNVLRAETIAMINRMLGLTGVDAEDCTVLPADVASDYWAYGEILTALNSDISDLKK